MNNGVLFILIFIVSVLISSFSQFLLKKSANKEYKNVKAEYLNPLVISAYGLFFGSTFVTVYAFRYVPLSLGPVLESLGYVFVAVLGFTLLHEKVSLRKVLGMTLIVVGVVFCSF